MSKLSKKDFDDYLGQESFYSEKDEERFFNTLNGTVQNRRNWFPQLVSVMVILGIFFVGFQFIDLDSPSTSNTNDNEVQFESLETADSIKEVESYYEKISPGLEQAKELGLVTEVDKTVKMEDSSTLHIDKIWYNSEEILIYYSIGISKVMGQLPPEITHFYVEPYAEGAFQGQSLTRGGIGGFEGIIYKDRYYHRVGVRPIVDQSNDPLSEFNGKITAFITVDQHVGNVETLEVRLPLHFNKTSEPMVSVPINQTIDKNDVTITIDKIEIELTGTQIYGNIDNASGDHVNRIDGKLTATFDGGRLLPISFSQALRSEGDFSFNLQAFDSLPEKITFTIDKIDFTGDESFEFSLDVSDYEEKLASSPDGYDKRVHKKIGNVRNTTIYLERIHYGDQGVGFSLVYQPENFKQEVRLVATTPSISKKESIKLPNTLTMVNEQGVPGELGARGSDSWKGGPPIGLDTEQQFFIKLDKSFVKASERIDVTIGNLLYKVKIGESISFPVEEN